MERTVSLMMMMSKRYLLYSLAAILCPGLGTVEAGWVDPDSPRIAQSTTALTKEDTREYQLVS